MSLLLSLLLSMVLWTLSDKHYVSSVSRCLIYLQDVSSTTCDAVKVKG